MKTYLCILLLFAATPAYAQDTAADSTPSRPYLAAAFGGTIGVGIGWLAGGTIGAGAADCNYRDAGSDWCGFEEFAVGAIVGGTVGAAAGAYLATRLSDAHPNPFVPIVSSVVGIGTGFLAGAALDRGLGLPARPVFVGVAIGQGAFTGWLTARFSEPRRTR